MRVAVVFAGLLLFLACVLPAPATTSAVKRHAASQQASPQGYPSFWVKQAHCIHYEEVRASWSKGWHTHFVYGTHVESRDRGGMQILVSTWKAFAPKGWPRDPAKASRAQQLLVTWRIWRANGRRWGGNQWPQSAAACGVS